MSQPIDRNIVILAANAIRPGEWASFGDIAAAIGHPSAVRAVVAILASSPTVPWWRLRSADGRWTCGSAGDRARSQVVTDVERLAGFEGITIVEGVATQDNRVSPARLAKRIAKLVSA